MRNTLLCAPLLLAALALGGPATPAHAQTFATDDPVLRRIWNQGMGEQSQAYRLSQVLLDSIGPRLTASPGHVDAIEWALGRYEGWGIPARKEQYGTWNAWRRGYTRIELTAPRFRTLEGTMLGWSPGTEGPVEGAVVPFPDLPDSAAYDRWMAGLQGEFVLLSFPETTCRPDESWMALARPETVERMTAERQRAQAAWYGNLRRAGANLTDRLDASGAGAVLTSYWSQVWGVDKIHTTENTRVPALDVSCEDYGLLYRLAENGQGPRVRLDADAEPLGERPAYNVIAELRGSELPEEYVILSAHFDSFDSASGATDNGTGSIMMMEAMRILKAAYPNPKRTILVGHWGGEEQGTNGSEAFAADHPEIVRGIQTGFNQDNGTWRIEAIRLQGFENARETFADWLDRMPGEIADTVQFDSPVREGGSDHSSFTCYGAPVVRLQSHYPEYRQYTWHTNRDTFDKIVMDDLRNNATLVAMLAYLAAEAPERISWERDPPPPDAMGRVGSWPECSSPRRGSGRG